MELISPYTIVIFMTRMQMFFTDVEHYEFF